MLTTNILLETFSNYQVDNHLEPDVSFASIALLPESVEDMSKSALYICPLSTALARNGSQAGFSYLCMRNRMPDALENDASLKGIMIINSNISIEALFTITNKRLLEMRTWIDNLRLACLSKSGFQKLIDVSEAVIPNALYALNASYSVTAYSKNNRDDTPCNQKLIELGYHPPEFVDQLRQSGRWELYEDSHGILAKEPGDINRYPALSKWLYHRGRRCMHIVMICHVMDPTPYLCDIFKIFLDHCQLYLSEMQQSNNIFLSAGQMLLNDILFSDLKHPRIIAERCASNNYLYYGNFNVFRIHFHYNESVPVERVAKELELLLPKSEVLIHGYEIIMLNRYKSEKVSRECVAPLDKIRPLLEKYDAICGVSEPFFELSNVKTAYTEAIRAANIGEKLRPIMEYWSFDEEALHSLSAYRDDCYIFFFDNIYNHYMVFNTRIADIDILQNTVYTKTVFEMYKKDVESNSDNLRILFAYLLSERRTSVAGQMLHMHRNNVLYRIQKIEENFDLDLADYCVRQKLLTGIYFLECTVCEL